MKSLFEDTKVDQEKIVLREKQEKEKKQERPIINVRFRNAEDVIAFGKLFGFSITDKTKIVDYPVRSLFDDEQEIVINGSETKEIEEGKVWDDVWREMPEFIQENNDAFKIIQLRLNKLNYADLSKKLDQNISAKTKSIWYPKLIRDENIKKRWMIQSDKAVPEPKHPIYIVSKGRYEIRQTANSLERMKQPYYIVVEEQEYKQYKNAIDSNYGTVIVLDQRFKETYDVFDEFGLEKSTGPGPARNFAWQHSISLGAEYHWVMDDNINDFYRLHNNQRIRVGSGVCFRICEDFVERYENVPVSGLQYRFFIAQDGKYPPYVFNTRIYSCLLIQNQNKLWYADTKYEPYVWRGRYNEDTDLSLRVLGNHSYKDIEPMCTVQFNAFLQGKSGTQQLKGGNTDEFYSVDDMKDGKDVFRGTSFKSDMLFRMHPNVSRNVWRYNRWHHEVCYQSFKKNKPILKPGIELKNEVNNYGMELITNYEGA